MKILMYVYGDITTDARVQRAGNVLAQEHDVTVISNQQNKELPSTRFRNILVGKPGYNLRTYLLTILQARKIVKREKPDVLYGHDYYAALLLKFFLGRKYSNKIVYDAHELYVPEKGKPFPFRSRVFYWIEKSIVKKVDLLICASRERAEKMVLHYKLSDIPVVIRNISQLKVEADNVPSEVESSLSSFFKKPGVTVVYAGVIVKSRKLDELVEALGQLAPKYKLLVVGGGSFYEELKSIASSFASLETLFTGPVPYSALGAILARCDVGFIYYPVDTLNNIYCASNKLYEYASVSLPILANNNPTIKKELDKYGIGVAADDFMYGLEHVLPQIALFKTNCRKFISENNWEKEKEGLLKAFRKYLYV